MKKVWKYLIPPIVLVAVITAVLVTTHKYKSFEGKIENVRIEGYRVKDEFRNLDPPFLELSFDVTRISVRTKKGKILDLAIYDNGLSKELLGKFIKGSYEPGNLLEIKGEDIILGFIDFPGPKIELKGKPTGVIKKYRIMDGRNLTNQGKNRRERNYQGER